MADADRPLARPSRGWTVLVLLFVVLSCVHVHLGEPGTAVDLRVDVVTVAVAALLWVPVLLEALLQRGGSLSAAGFQVELDVLRNLGTSEATAPARETAPDERLRELEEDYESLRRTLPSSFARAAALEGVLATARLSADRWAGLLPGRLAVFRDAPEGARIVTLAVLQGLQETLPAGWLEAVLDAVKRPRSEFEQYHALRLVRLRLHECGQADTEKVRRALQRIVDSGALPTGDRAAIITDVLSAVGADSRA